MRGGWHHGYVPKPMTSNAKAEGRFGKQDFRYVADEDKRFTNRQSGHD